MLLNQALAKGGKNSKNQPVVAAFHSASSRDGCERPASLHLLQARDEASLLLAGANKAFPVELTRSNNNRNGGVTQGPVALRSRDLSTVKGFLTSHVQRQFLLP